MLGLRTFHALPCGIHEMISWNSFWAKMAYSLTGNFWTRMELSPLPRVDGAVAEVGTRPATSSSLVSSRSPKSRYLYTFCPLESTLTVSSASIGGKLGSCSSLSRSSE